MESDLYFNFLWLAPLVAYFTTRDKPQITRNIITATSLGLVVTYGLKGLYALYFMWPVSDLFGQGVFYLRFIHDVSATRIAILLQILTFDSPITDQQRLLLDLFKVFFWGLTYGFLGYLWGYFKHKYPSKNLK